MAEQRLRLGLVGVGNNAANHHLPAYRLLPEVEVAACCATSPERARAASQRLGIPGSYDDAATMIRSERLDAVIVCSTNDAHHRNTLDALAAGAHVLCEKPMGLDRHQARAMCEAAARSGRRTMAAYTYRFVPAAKLARELIDSGELGDLFTFQAAYVSAYLADLTTPVEKPWKLMGHKGGGVLCDLGSHLIYLTRWWFGEIARVGGVKQTIAARRTLSDASELAVDVDDACAFAAEFASGLAGSYFVTKYATGRANCQRIEVYGRKGALSYDVERPGELSVCLGVDACRTRRWSAIPVPARLDNPASVAGLEGYRLEQARTFMEGILRGGPMEPTFADGLACQEVLDAVAASAASPSWVEIER
jgi:predicted dehydrogenase